MKHCEASKPVLGVFTGSPQQEDPTMTQKQTFEKKYDSFYSVKMTASNRARGNELKFLISAQQHFKWLRYR